jgi:hypothetical protein
MSAPCREYHKAFTATMVRAWETGRSEKMMKVVFGIGSGLADGAS